MGLEHADFMLLFDQWAGTYDQTVYRSDPVDGFEGYQTVLEQVAAWAGAAPGRRVLDVGTGTGNLAALLVSRGAVVTAVEPSAAMRAIAAEKLGSTPLLDGHFLSLPLPAQSQDAVVSSYAFHHLTDEQKACGAREMLRVLRPGGTIVIGDVAWANEAARRATIEQAAAEGKAELVQEIEEEYYPTVGTLTAIFAAQGCRVSVEQVTPWVWILAASPRDRTG